MKHIHWTIIGYEKQVGAELQEAVEINVVADDEKQALVEAKKLIKKNHYKIRSVKGECQFEEHSTELSLEIQKRMYKLLKKNI